MDKARLQSFCLALPGTTHDYQVDWQADRYHVGRKKLTMTGEDSQRKPIITLKCDPIRAGKLRETYQGIQMMLQRFTSLFG